MKYPYMFETLIYIGILIFVALVAVLVTLLIWNKPSAVIYILLIYCCFFRILIAMGIPGFIKNFLDYLSIILLLQIVLQFNKAKNLNIRIPLLFMFLFLVVAIISTAANGSNVVLFIWGLRVNYRFFIFFIACTMFLKSKDLDNLMQFLLFILPINTVAVLFEYFVLDLRFDWVGGLFGTHLGCNDELVIYLILTTAIAIVFYTIKKINLLSFIFYIGMIALISAFAELKIIYVLLIAMLFIVFILTFPNARVIKMGIICGIFLSVSIIAMLIIYPYWRKAFSDIGKIFAETMVEDYDHVGGLSRLKAGPYIYDHILVEPFQKLFGIGFGNADGFLAYGSNFYNRYSGTNYKSFRYTLVLVEIGLIGLIVYCLFFVSILTENIRIKIKLKNNYEHYFYLSFIISLIIFPLLIYNASIYGDGGFSLFFFLSFPFILEKEKFEENYIYKITPLKESNGSK